MPEKLSADELLNREFLTVRARILDIAAALDRIESAAGTAKTDPRIDLLHRAIDELKKTGSDRAERVQMLFSRAYDPAWREDK